MSNALKAGAAYFLIVFVAGFLFGVIRSLFVMPAVGPLAAVLIELPFILAVSWIACSWVLRRSSVASDFSHRLAMGAFALVLLLVAEAFVSITIDGRLLSEHFTLYKTLPAIVGLFGQILFALFPVVQTNGR